MWQPAAACRSARDGFRRTQLKQAAAQFQVPVIVQAAVRLTAFRCGTSGAVGLKPTARLAGSGSECQPAPSGGRHTRPNTTPLSLHRIKACGGGFVPRSEWARGDSCKLKECSLFTEQRGASSVAPPGTDALCRRLGPAAARPPYRLLRPVKAV